jgi:hypothetical protein
MGLDVMCAASYFVLAVEIQRTGAANIATIACPQQRVTGC